VEWNNLNKKMNIVVAEDEVLNSMLIERVLKKMGHTVTLVTNGEQLIEICKHTSFDVLLVDISMPIVDGIQAIETIRTTQNPNMSTKICMLSANYPKQFTLLKQMYSISNIILKPFTVEDITEKIKTV